MARSHWRHILFDRILFASQLLRFDANAIAAGASAIAGVAAFLSASESGKTAREAIRALSYATKPVIMVTKLNNDLEGSILSIQNVSMFPISRMRVSWEHPDGSKGHTDHGLMPGITRYGAPLAEGGKTRVHQVRLPKWGPLIGAQLENNLQRLCFRLSGSDC